MANLFHRRILININLPPPPNDKFVQDPIIQESLSSPTAARLMTDRSGRGDRRDRDRRRDEEKRGRSRDRRAKKTNRSRDRERRGRDEETDRSRSSKPVLVPAQAAPAPAPSAEAAAPGEAEATEPPSHDDEEGEESEDCVMDPTVSVDDLRPVKHAVPEAGEAARPGPAKAETSTRTTTTHKRSGGPPQPHQGETKRDHGHKTGEKRAQGHKPGEKRDQGHKPGEKRDQGHEKRDQGHKPGVKRDQGHKPESKRKDESHQGDKADQGEKPQGQTDDDKTGRYECSVCNRVVGGGIAGSWQHRRSPYHLACYHYWNHNETIRWKNCLEEGQRWSKHCWSTNTAGPEDDTLPNKPKKKQRSPVPVRSEVDTKRSRFDKDHQGDPGPDGGAGSSGRNLLLQMWQATLKELI